MPSNGVTPFPPATKRILVSQPSSIVNVFWTVSESASGVTIRPVAFAAVTAEPHVTLLHRPHALLLPSSQTSQPASTVRSPHVPPVLFCDDWQSAAQVRHDVLYGQVVTPLSTPRSQTSPSAA